jgi:hypothetical protein
MEKEKEVCLAVKNYFAQQNIKLVDVARMLNASPQTVTEHLSGERFFGRARANKYAELFGFNPTYLMTGTGSLLLGDPAEGGEQASAQEKVERLLATIESQQRTIEILARKLG